MKLARLNVDGVRNLSQQTISAFGDINIFYGANGAGKTSLLEAVHILGLARSFRSTQLRPVIHYEQSECTIFGEVIQSDLRHAIGIKREKSGGFRLRIDADNEKNLARLANLLPIQLINTNTYSLLEGGAKQRRQFLDWGVFHVEQQFYRAWKRLQRCIKQRNALLKNHRNNRVANFDQSLLSWNEELETVSAFIDRARSSYFVDFNRVFLSYLDQLNPIEGLKIHYVKGWDVKQTIKEALSSAIERDKRYGITHSGPHRADLKITVNGHSAGSVLSRGQQKLVVSAMRLAQCALLDQQQQKKTILLIDDLPAEIDPEKQAKLCQLLGSLDMQLFLTCVLHEQLSEHHWPANNDLKVFHVEHGHIQLSSIRPQ